MPPRPAPQQRLAALPPLTPDRRWSLRWCHAVVSVGLAKQEREIEARIKQAGLVEKQRALAEKEAALAQELERRKNEEARKAMVIEKVRAEAPELRELEQ